MARLKDDYRSLTGPQKAGMFMLSIGPARASALPPDIRERFDRIQDAAVKQARKSGWNPDLDIQEDS